MLKLRNVKIDHEEETEEDEGVPNTWFQSGHICTCCGDKLAYTDEVFLLEVVEAAQDHGQILCEPITTDEGDYEFEPLMVHLECWEEAIEQIRELREDEPPVESMDGILVCAQCQSSIVSFEPFVSATFGEIHVSQRKPNGEYADKMEKLAPMCPTCMPCMVRVIEDYFDDWEGLLEMLEVNFGNDDGEE